MRTISLLALIMTFFLGACSPLQPVSSEPIIATEPAVIHEPVSVSVDAMKPAADGQAGCVEAMSLETDG